LTLAALVLPTNDALAQAYGTELPFVLGTDARVSAMGLAGVSLRGDASLQYYNPAAMSYLQWKQFSFFRSVLFESDVLYHTISYGHPLLNYGTLAVSLMRVDVSGVEERDDKNQLVSSDLHNAQTRLLLGYSRLVTSSISAGFNIKVDNQSFGSYSSSGIGLDVGIAASQHINGHGLIRGFRQGFAIQNVIEPAVKLDQEKVADPMQVALGVTMLSHIGAAFMETAIDLVSPRFSPTRLQVGQEVRYADMFSFRFGLDASSPVYGLGARYKSATLDYAYKTTDLGANHQFSFSVRFGASTSQQKNEARTRLERQVNDGISQRMDDLEKSQISAALQTGDSLFALGQYDKAAARFESALLWDPGNEHAEEYLARSDYNRLVEQGFIAMGREDYVQALFNYRQALELMPDDSDAREKIDLCNQEIIASQNSAALVNNLLKTSIDLYANREFTSALAGFDELTRLDPSNELAADYRLKCLMQIEEIVQKHLRDSQIAVDRGDYQSAIAELEQALTYEPSNGLIKERIAKLERERRKAAASVMEPTAKPTTTATPSPVNAEELEGKYKRGMTHFNDGRFDLAVGLFMEVWTADANFHDVGPLLTKSYLLIGMRLYSQDQYEGAIETWKKALAIDPNNVKVRRYLRRVGAEFEKSKAYDE
jgi:tetratricopeptide (TPR) repeat protein